MSPEDEVVFLRSARDGLMREVAVLKQRLSLAQAIEVQRNEAWRKLDELERRLAQELYDNGRLRSKLKSLEGVTS